MKKESSYLLAGVVLFAIMLGFLIGASSSPVAGLFITGSLGGLIGIAGLLFNQKILKSDEKQGISIGNVGIKIIKAIGIYLSLFSLFIVLGSLSGSWYRRHLTNLSPITIWTKENAPKTTQEALDWTVTIQILQKRGYSINQIKEIYNIRIKELNDPTKKDDQYDYEYPYHKILSPTNEELEGLRTNNSAESIKAPRF